MFGKREPVLTAAYCEPLYLLRVALEVLTGQYVRIVCIDFNTGKGKVVIGSTEFNLSFMRNVDSVSFSYHHRVPRHCAFFTGELGEVRVVNDCPTTRTDKWWVGRSAAERREASFR